MKAAKFLFVSGIVLLFGSMITCALLATWGADVEALPARLVGTGVCTGFTLLLTSAITALYSEW